MRYSALPLLLCSVAAAQNASSPTCAWLSDFKLFDQDNYDRLQFELNSAKLTGKLGNDAIDGTFQNGRIEATVKYRQRNVQLRGALQGDRIEGSATIAEDKVEFKWEAVRQSSANAAPRTHTFEP